MVSGDLVILATGGEGHSLTAFASDSGEIRWTAGDDTVKYQTPTILELGNVAMALVASNLAAAVVAKQKSPNATEAVKVYHEVIEELRQRQPVQPE